MVRNIDQQFARMSEKARGGLLRAAFLLLAACALLGAMASPAAAWSPEPPTFGVGSLTSQPVTMSDGTVLETNVYYPTNPATGAEASGTFPVLLTQTPYGKDVVALGGGPDSYMVERGYIEVVADVRGTGGSEGQFGLFDPVQGTDGATLVNWAAALPHSDGDVGLLGASYLGINQFATAADAGSTHVKAMFPIISDNELYRDSAFAGGFLDIEFDGTYLGQTSAFNTLFPAYEHNTDLLTVEADHINDISSFDAALFGNIEEGGDEAYDGAYWQARSDVGTTEKILKDGIPAFLVGGWYDLFQRGELLNYSSFQNAYDGRPLLAAMTPTQPVTSRYQLLQGPWFHLTAGDGLDYHGLDLNGLELAWFDHWLKGLDTGITDTSTPLHLEDLATGKYMEATRYPLNQATDHTYYLHAGGALSPARPSASGGADTLVFTGSEIPCTNSTEQWAAGKGASTLLLLGLHDPCTQVANGSQVGPGTQSYTTAPFTQATTLAGPIGASLYATTTTTDSEWVVQISDVAPDGIATPLTSGLLEGEQRAIDPALTWTAPDGQPLLPYHPYTETVLQPAIPGKLTRYDVEIFPTFDTFEPGHRLRVTIATSDFPHAVPIIPRLPDLIGGVYALEHNASGPSSVELPLIAAPQKVLQPVAPTPLGCPAPTGALSRTSLGPVRLGMTRAQARRALPDSISTRGRHYMDFFCLNMSGIRVGYPSPKLLRSLPASQRRRAQGRVVLALTANRHYSIRGVRPDTRLGSIAGRLHVGKGLAIGLNTWYLFANRVSRGVFKVRHGVIEEIGIADQALTRGARAEWRFMTSFS